MKIRQKYIITSLVVVILLILPALLFSTEPVMVKQPITMQGVYFSQTARNVPLTAPLQNAPSAPAPLAAQARNNAINQIRGAAGLQMLIPTQPTQPVMPPRVILTPWVPQSGQNYYNITHGLNAPFDGYSQIYPTSETGGRLGSIWIRFETIPGKTYMVDLMVRPFQNRTFTVKGVFDGSVNPVNDHLILGFTATEPTSKLDVKNGAGFYFWRCELTQVN